MINVSIPAMPETVEFIDLNAGDFFLFDYGRGQGVELWQKLSEDLEKNAQRFTEGGVDREYTFDREDRVYLCPVINITVGEME